MMPQAWCSSAGAGEGAGLPYREAVLGMGRAIRGSCAAMVNQYDVYAVDRDFEPFFLKFSSDLPYNAKLCLNGHEYAKRQLAKAPSRRSTMASTPASSLQAIRDGLSPAKIDALSQVAASSATPFTADDRRAGHRYDISILQAEF